MAKPKKYISSKLKVKRKFLLGGDPGQELYLNGNTTYQAVDAPTAMLQQQFDANEQLKAKQNTAIFGNQMARQMDYLQDLNAASEQRKKEEETTRQQQAEANKQVVDQQVTQTAGKAAKDLTKSIKSGLLTSAVPIATNYYSPTWTSVNPMPAAPASYGTPMTVSPAMETATSTTGELFAGTPTVGQNMATTTTTSSFGQSAAAIGKSLGKSALIALPQIAGQIAYNQLNKADDRQMKREGRSEYYDDTDYSRKEFNAQMLKSTGKGATIGGTIGSMVPIPGVGTGLGMAIGAAVGAGVGAIKATHQRRMTKSEDERGVKIGNKRFGKKLLFGEENVYDENLDPTVIEKRNREAQLKAMTDTATALDNARMGSMLQSDLNTGFNLKTTTGQMAKYGGKLEYLKGGVAKDLGRGAKEYVGKKHEQGGIDLPGNIEVEGGETEQNNYIFSATLKLPTGITYAQAHKNLLASGASSEEIKQLALSQEAAAGRNPNKIKTMKFAKYGGPLKYDKGGDTSEIQYAGIDPENEGFDANTIENAQLLQDNATGEYVYRAPDGTELGRSKDRNRALQKAEKNLAKKYNTIGVNSSANNITTEDNKTYKSADLPEVSITGERPKVNTEVTNTTTQNNPPANTTTTTQTNNDQPVVNTNPSGTVTYTTSDKAVATKTPTGKPRFFMGASRIVDENGNVQIVTDRPLMGHGNMAGSRLGTPTEQGLEDVRSNSYDAAGNLKKGAEYKNTKTGANLSSSDAVNDRETIAGTEWGKRWGYRPGMSAAEAKSAHDAFASEMRTKFDQSPDEMLGYYQYLIDSGKVDPKTGKRDYTGEDSFGDDARAIYENLQSKGYIDANGKIKSEALPYLRTQATNEFVGPIHNAAGAYTLKGKPTTNKIVEDPPPSGETPKKPLTELPPPPKYVPTKSTNNIGLLQTIPGAYAIANPINVKPIAPSLAMGYVTPGAVGRTNIGRVSYNTERAANQGNLSAMNQALQNMSGPGAVAGMLAAKTKADQQNLAIANAEQNANIGLAAKEAELNAGISKFNVGNAMQAQITNAGIAQQNAARMQQASQFNTQLKYAKDVENREQILGALDRGTAAIVQNNLANRQLDATERLAGVYDAYSAYNRYLGNTKKEEEKTNQVAKFGGAKKYISRLGDLKNVKYKV